MSDKLDLTPMVKMAEAQLPYMVVSATFMKVFREVIKTEKPPFMPTIGKPNGET
jgi:hypothetical protein